MCGIAGYIGPNPALPVLVEGLRRLEYRGYDSAGVALLDGDSLWIQKTVGRVADLSSRVEGGPEASVGIAHTRWATHGGITEANAHPHIDTNSRIAVVHNGIIENMTALRNQLSGKGSPFARRPIPKSFLISFESTIVATPAKRCVRQPSSCRAPTGWL